VSPERIGIETGHFLFSSITGSAGALLGMSGKFFGFTGCPGHIRVNLLNGAAIDALTGAGTGLPHR
jgi:hypothetical protein